MDLPAPRAELAAVTVGGTSYAVGGADKNLLLSKKVEEYNPVTNKWRSLAPMPTARHGLGAAVLGERIYAVGGCCTDENEVEEYNPATNKWESRTPMSTPRYYHAVVAANGKIFAIGGYQDYKIFLSVMEAYEPPYIVNELSLVNQFSFLLPISLILLSVFWWGRKLK